MLNTIICGDSEKVLKEFPDNWIDAVITSPPFNLHRAYDVYNDDLEWDKYFQKLFAILKECFRVLKDDGRLIIEIQPAYSKYIPTHHIISNFLLNELKMLFYTEILWDRAHYNARTTQWGSFCLPSMPYFKNTFSFILVYSKRERKHKGERKNADILPSEFWKWITGKWQIKPETELEKRYNHPAPFPEELVVRLIKLFTYKGDIILDPFCGIGTTCIVAKKLERNFIGIDISPNYCEIAKKRLKQLDFRLV
jgi:DNA modification methylase